jgi:TolB protein
VYHVRGVATRGANMAVRILLVLADFAIFYGCGQSNSPPEQGEKEGAESKNVTPSASAQQETIQKESTQQETIQQATTQQETTERSSEAAKPVSVGRCADNGSTHRQREGRGEDLHAKIAFERSTGENNFGDIYVATEDADETRLTNTTTADEAIPIWSPDGQKIAFERRTYNNNLSDFADDIYMMNADGTDVTRLTHTPGDDTWPTWSPDGKKIAFIRDPEANGDIYVMNANGTNQTRVSNTKATGSLMTHYEPPTWSPDGKKIAFAASTAYPDRGDSAAATASATVSATDRTNMSGIFVVNADGTGLRKLHNEAAFGRDPAWSPDGKKIAFASWIDHIVNNPSEIYVVKPDGTDQTRITKSQNYENLGYAWSPDGQKIAFIGENGNSSHDVYVMNADGSNVTRLTNTADSDMNPTWSPDSKMIAFTRSGYTFGSLYVISADGTTNETCLTDLEGDHTLVWVPRDK